MENKLIPKLRFPGFEEEWIITNIGNTFSIFNGYAFKGDDSVENGVRWLKIADVGINKISNHNKSYLPLEYIEKYKKFILEEGDYVIALTRPILSGELKIAKVNKEAAGALLNQRVGKLVTNNISTFIYLLLQRNNLINIINNNIAGTDPPNLSPNEINFIDIKLPSLPEQQKIADYLSTIDKKITLLEEKKEELSCYKKAMMQKLFSQEIRFKDEAGNDFQEWEEKRLGEVLSFGSGRDYKHLSQGNIPVYGTGGKMLSVNDYLYEGDSVCIGRKGTIDKPLFLQGRFWTVDTLFYTYGFYYSLPKFMYYIFQSINWKTYNEASGVPSLSKSTLEKILVKIPSLSEQQKVADFLSAIDTSIDKVKEQIEQTQAFKKAMLQQLFV